MLRRTFLSASAGALVLPGCGGGSEDNSTLTVTPSTANNGGAVCNLSAVPVSTAKVDLSSFYQRAAQRQYQNLWCWAACVAMIFAQAGHPVTQARIVSEVYGAPYNMAAPGYVIAAALNRVWIDDRGQRFRALLTGVYDYYAGYLSITDATIVNTVAGGTPMVIATGTHARTLVEVDYFPSAFGPQLTGALVFDPWTGSLACATAQELTLANRGGQLAFLASVAISNA